MDTPGGLDSSMRDIIRAILASPVPVATYVTPSGARAASAGTYILYASHVAAMAPATNLGAATPVSIGGEPEPAPPVVPAPAPQGRSPPAKGSSPPAGGEGAAPESPPAGSAMERKVVNDAVAYIRGLAELRGRNADWAEQAVRGAASLTASAALGQKVIDLVARDLPDLLAQADGREVRVDDRTVKLATRDLTEVRVKPDWRTELLAVITNPTVAYGLMLIGIWGLLLEGYNPGAVLPGVVGSICLLVALFAFQILSVNYAGLALVVLGTAMIIAEFFFPTYGSLGIGGLISFVVGSLILFDSDVPGFSVGRPLIAALATVGAAAIAGIVYLGTRAMRRPIATGAQGMIGESAEVLSDFTGKGRVRYGGELWNAHSERALHAGELARIVRVEGLTLWVEPQ
jgi:membrane-bound serine protease (ClpP class)